MNKQEVNQLTMTIETLDAVKADLEALRTSKQVEPAPQVGPGSILVSELAELLKDHGVQIGTMRLFAWLRENGYVRRLACGQNLPTQKSIDLHFMAACDSVLITPTGVQYFFYTVIQEKEAINAKEKEKKRLKGQREVLARKAKRDQYKAG